MESTLVSSVTETLPADCQRKLEGYAKAIDKARAKGVDSMMEIGRALCAARDLLANHGNGVFGAWIEQRCGVSRKSAENYANVHEAFNNKDCERLSQSSTAEALYFLARDTTPEDAIERAVEAAEAGERITLKKAKAIVAECTAQPATEEGNEASPDDEPPLPAGLRPYESLTAACAALDTSLTAFYLRWPQEYLTVLADKLNAYAEELQDKGEAAC